jgi:leucyl/phenylalanyl-tRNA--protein transferase
MQKSNWQAKADTAFTEVMRSCAAVQRPDQDGTWITDEMIEGYTALHHMGFAHSIEIWDESNVLIGGLYGVSLGTAFFGESMFTLKSNASKMAFAVLAAQLIAWDFDLIDCQAHTAHLERFGAKPMARKQFLAALGAALKRPTRKSPWQLQFSLPQAAAFWREQLRSTR